MEPADLMAELDGLQVDDSSVKKTRRLASKKGSSNLGIENVGDDDGIPPPLAPAGTRRNRTGAGITFAQKLSAMTFFRLCDFCLSHDNDADPIEPACNRYWMYYVMVMVMVQTDGRCCYYCGRVFLATAKTKYKTLTQYKQAIKDDGSGELHDKHMKYMHWMIQQLTQEFERTGSRGNLYGDYKLSWPQPWTLLRMEIVQVIWDLPEEVFREEAEYFKEFSQLQEGDSLCKGPGGNK